MSPRTATALLLAALALAGCGTKSGGTAHRGNAGSQRGPEIAGSYVMTATRAQIDARPEHPVGEKDNWGSFRLVLGPRSFRISDKRPPGAPTVPDRLGRPVSSGWSAGTYRVKGDRIVFTPHAAAGDTPLGASGDLPIVCRWSLFRNALSFQQLPEPAKTSLADKGFDTQGPPLLYVKPWRKVR